MEEHELFRLAGFLCKTHLLAVNYIHVDSFCEGGYFFLQERQKCLPVGGPGFGELHP